MLAHTEAAKASTSVLAIPVIGVLSGVILLKEPIYWNTAVGMILILSGIMLVNKERKSCKQALR
ncbi:EamA family transporter [Sporomusa acidovorans]|uniref:EamA family transporter n=1 Tax=Sporomusa acidovorans TaxID=112900 RepID=UPI000B81E044|nr:EamA family transporter [Sporomusa acidovorans]